MSASSTYALAVLDPGHEFSSGGATLTAVSGSPVLLGSPWYLDLALGLLQGREGNAATEALVLTGYAHPSMRDAYDLAPAEVDAWASHLDVARLLDTVLAQPADDARSALTSPTFLGGLAAGALAGGILAYLLVR